MPGWAASLPRALGPPCSSGLGPCVHVLILLKVSLCPLCVDLLQSSVYYDQRGRL